MPSEQEYQLHPVVPDSVAHNGKVRNFHSGGIPGRCFLTLVFKVLSNLHSLTASLFGVAAGILGLESYSGFLMYLLFSIITALLFYALRVAPESLAEGRSTLSTGRFFTSAFDFWTSGIFNGLSGFVLTWTLFYGLVQA